MKERIKLWWKRLTCHHVWQREWYLFDDGSGIPLYQCHCTKCGKVDYFEYWEDGIDL